MWVKRAVVGLGMVAAIASGYASYGGKAVVHPSVSAHLDTARTKVLDGKPTEAIGYAEAMLMGDKITVSVDYGDTPASQIPACDTAISGAFEMWETVLKGQLKFERVPDESAAQVKIRFGKDVTLDKQIVSGYIKWSRSIEVTGAGTRPVFSADMNLRTTDPRGREMNAIAMRHTAGHEFGHLFGLDDVNTIGYLMGPLDLRKPVSKPTPEEANTVIAIRAECQSILDAAKAKGLHAHHFLGLGSCAHHEHDHGHDHDHDHDHDHHHSCH